MCVPLVIVETSLRFVGQLPLSGHLAPYTVRGIMPDLQLIVITEEAAW
jgi:hypothetical protein